ncbi:MAG: hypothetical protein ABNH29_16810 [Paracoccus sp. (in: a-proteobacteria)]|jgi:hypothetical protein|uniref:hypothetical protein n=1 Tax=Paracoccus sp. TaxID=267 RepID=UPI0032D8F1F8
MTDYNDGKWHGHNGERCPVHAQTVVEVVYHGLEGKPAYRTQPAVDLNWLNSKLIIAFRVIKEYREPREFWAVQNGNIHVGMWDDVQIAAGIASGNDAYEFIHLREVLE